MVDAEDVNVNNMVALLVIEPLVTVADVMVIVGGGAAKSTLVFPKNDWFVPVNEVETLLIVCCGFMVTTRFKEVLAKTLVVLIVVTEAGMFIEVNEEH